jgi:hypothetical protein
LFFCAFRDKGIGIARKKRNLTVKAAIIAEKDTGKTKKKMIGKAVILQSV